MTTTSRVSPLLSEHDALGATFTDFAGWQMPIKYGSELTEHHAVRRAVGLFDISHMAEIFVEGSAAGAALDYALVGELSKVTVGKAKYSLMCDSSGGIVDDLVVYRLAEHRYLVVANAANTEAVANELRVRSVGFDVAVSDQSSDVSLIAVQGPASESAVTTVVPDALREAVHALKYYAILSAEVAGVEVLIARTGYTGEDGFELYVARDQAVELWRTLYGTVTAHGGSAAGLACRDTLRLEAGMPLYGNELTRSTNPYEAGLDRVVRLTKDFVGRSALATIAQSVPTRTLVGLKGSGKRAARSGYAVSDPSFDDAVGIITSGALSPTLNYPVAMAYVPTELAQTGTDLIVDIRAKEATFTVAPLPFYKRS